MIDIEKEREAFQQFYAGVKLARSESGTYISAPIELLWAGWQARAEHQAKTDSALIEKIDAAMEGK